MCFMLLRRFAALTFSCFVPPRCRGCRVPLLDCSNPYLCPTCAGEVRWIGTGACRGCGFPGGPHGSVRDECQRCRGGRLRLTGAAAVARYGGGARDLVKAFKFGGETELAKPLAGLMAARMRNADFFGRIDAAVPVALHAARKRERGFDQAAMLAGLVGRELGLRVLSAGVSRREPTIPQATLRRAERLRNMEGVFVADKAVSGQRIILIDDVMTTGATMADCARACREAGAARVYALVFAR